ncbi:N-6 DNA methylase [bacterium]|nr:N-6 DNA methylase [bacterium]
MLDTETKRRIDTARDILVGKIPDPKSQVEQITIALIYKFMYDIDRESVELGGKEKFFSGEYKKYAWNKIFDVGMGGVEIVNLYGEAIQKMNQNPNIPPLFQDIFKNAYLPYRDPETLKIFLKVINEFQYDHSERLGDAFEYLLSVLGSQGDAGQFRTPRHIIDFMVEIISPRKHETILDPACGTAGFLISAYKYILKHNSSNYNPAEDKKSFEQQDVNLEELTINSTKYSGDKLLSDDKAQLVENIYGYDISPDMVRLSLVNMYLHQFNNPKIHEYDTLTSQDRWEERADVIMANPPFMSPKGGIRPHQRFTIKSKRSEVLFVDYIAEHLNPQGRSAVIVPEGIIFQAQNAHKNLRKMLVENGFLVGVISLPPGVFHPYSGVKTSILWIDKRLAKKTDKILFVNIENDGFHLGAQRRPIKENDLPNAYNLIQEYKETIETGKKFNTEKWENILLVEKEKILESEDYNLTGARYKPSPHINTKWQLVELREVAEIASGNSAPQGDKYFQSGIYPFYRTFDVGKVHISDTLNISKDYVNDLAIKEKKLRLFDKNTILFPKSGASTFLNHRAMLSKAGYVSSHLAAIIPDEKRVSPLFLFHLLCDIDAKTLTSEQAYPSLKLSAIKKIKIPLPPLLVQQEIVAEIESYQKIIDGAKQVVENYKPTLKIDSHWKKLKFVDVTLEIRNGVNVKQVDNKGKYKVTRIQTISYGTVDLGKTKWTNDEPPENYFMEEGDILLSHINSFEHLAKTAIFTNIQEKVVHGINLIRYRFNKKLIIPDYAILFMKSDEFINRAKVFAQKAVNQASIKISDLNNIEIPCPDLNIQKAIVAKMEEEEELVNSNKKLIEIYEEKTKSCISKVWGS